MSLSDPSRTTAAGPFDNPDVDELFGLGSDEAARKHLAAGRPIFYMDDEHPNRIVREHPDGRRKIVEIADDAKIRVVCRI